jgi:hypothetical protein
MNKIDLQNTRNPYDSPQVDPRLTTSWPEWGWTLWSMAAAFGTYFCMYAFRVPFKASAYTDDQIWGWDAKVILVVAQVMGYATSKFLAIKFVSEMRPERRALAILVLIGLAEAALVLFGVVPVVLQPICLFANGLPLGMVFGLVLGFLEGRQVTEALAAGLCASFILADGMMKSVGTYVLQQGCSEVWMPCLVGLMFVMPLVFFVWMLSRIPRPSLADEVARSVRQPIDGKQRLEFLRKYGWGLFPVVGIYLLTTILRSIRGDFAPELWRELGQATAPAIFTQSESFIALVVILFNGTAIYIADNRRALLFALGTCAFGGVLLSSVILLRSIITIDPMTMMIMIGLGLYLPYVAIHTTVLERMIALTRDHGNLGFLMSVVDAAGYFGYVIVMLVRNAVSKDTKLLSFYFEFSLVAALISIAAAVFSAWYFASKLQLKPA